MPSKVQVHLYRIKCMNVELLPSASGCAEHIVLYRLRMERSSTYEQSTHVQVQELMLLAPECPELPVLLSTIHQVSPPDDVAAESMNSVLLATGDAQKVEST